MAEEKKPTRRRRKAEDTAALEENSPEAPPAEAEDAIAPADSPEDTEAAAEADAPLAATAEPKRPRRSLRPKRESKQPARAKAPSRKPITRGQSKVSEPRRRQERRGVVVSDKGEKTIIVKVDVIKAHPKYKKVVRRSQKFHAHDERNTAGVGDVVRIVETRPLSKTKHWRLAEVVEKAR